MMITVCCFTQENWFDEDSLSGLPVSSLFSKAAWHKAHNHADTAMGFYLLIVRKMSSMPDTTSQRFCAQSCVDWATSISRKATTPKHSHHSPQP